MTLQKVNEYVEKRIDSLKFELGLAKNPITKKRLRLTIVELKIIHDLTSQIQSKTSQPVKFKEDENT